MSKHLQNQQSGNNSTNLQAGRDINLKQVAQSEEYDFGIIDEIFKSIVKNLRTGKHSSDKKHVSLNEKIEINFHNQEDRERVQQYFKFAYTKISLIEKRIQEEDIEIQNDLQGHIFENYNGFKDQNLGNIEILEELFKQFVIPTKKDNPEYRNLTRAFVLFFFDDCTIFDKTEFER